MTEAEREEKERRKKEKIRKFESPIPFVIILRNLIFGKKRPDIYTRITFYIGLGISSIFLIWSGISYFALISKDWIYENKGVSISWIVERRGSTLGFEKGEFITRLTTANGIAMVCWIIFFIGLVLLYRKKKLFIYFTMIPFVIYLLLNVFYLSFTYFMDDTTMFDKIALLILGLSLIMHSYLMGNERSGGSISFFGESSNPAVEEDDLDSAE